LDAAGNHLKEAVRLDSRLGTAWFYLAKIYLKTREFGEALKALDRAQAVDDKSTNVHYLRAQVLRQMGRPGDAAAELAIVKRLEQETASRLEQELKGGYRDPELVAK
jgi:tetratricopeptide (TPR) repeat protein